MKKALSFLLAVVLTCALSLVCFAQGPDVCFSMDGAAGKVGDTVEVKVSLTKNPGIWAAKFVVNYDADALRLTEVQNGTVFSDSQFVKGATESCGYYIYYAQLDGLNCNNYNEGQILSLTFEILETAAIGETSVYLTFPDNGVGWYFSGLDPTVDYTVPADGEVSCAVTVSDTPVYTAGDLNGDGKINAVDCNIMKTIIIGKTVAEDWQALAADMDGDGKVNIADSNLLRRAVTGKA